MLGTAEPGDVTRTAEPSGAALESLTAESAQDTETALMALLEDAVDDGAETT